MLQIYTSQPRYVNISIPLLRQASSVRRLPNLIVRGLGTTVTMESSRPSKRTVYDVDAGEAGGAQSSGSTSRATPRSLSRAVSPPLKKRRTSPPPEKEEYIPAKEQVEHQSQHQAAPQKEGQPCSSRRIVKSPFHLTRIRSLGEASNKDTVTLKDILGDPLIKECWEFNYMHNIDFLMNAFDEDVRHLVKVNVVHGFWKKEDSSRLQIQVNMSKSNSHLMLFVHFR